MRFYSFGNYYLSPIQQGIQSLHAIVNLIYKYRLHSDTKPLVVDDWATNHKTVVLLNGGNQEELYDIFSFFNVQRNPYPFDWFHEDAASLNCALTSVGIILPPSIYEGAVYFRDRRNSAFLLPEADFRTEPMYIIVDQFKNPVEEDPTEYTTFDIELMQRMNQYRLA